MEDCTYLLQLTRGETAPATGHVYVMFNADGVAIYVGQTVQPLSVRMRGHYQDNPAKIWAAARLEAEELPAEELTAAEAVLIHKYHPPLNKTCPIPGCTHYQGRMVRRVLRKGEITSVLADSALSDLVREAVTEARDSGRDRIFSAELLQFVESSYPDHNLKRGQLRQKIVGILGMESAPLHDQETGASSRGWYLYNIAPLS